MFVVVWCLALWVVCLCLVLCGLIADDICYVFVEFPVINSSCIKKNCPLWSSVYECHKVESAGEN